MNVSTIKKIISERPSVKIVCGPEVAEKLTNLARNTIILKQGMKFSKRLKHSHKANNKVIIEPVAVYHDVETFGYRIDLDGIKIFYATDTATLEGIEAKEYDYYFIESNYDEEVLKRVSLRNQEEGKFDDGQRVIDTHLSVQQCQEFYIKNKKEGSSLVTLHHSSRHM